MPSNAQVRRLARNPVLVLVVTAATLLATASLFDKAILAVRTTSDDRQLAPIGDLIDFEGFDNATGADHYIVPNIIHLIRFNKTEFSFVDFVVLQAAVRNHRPDYVYLHTDSPGGRFTGRYWQAIENDYEVMSRVRILPIEAPTEIFGQQLNPTWRYWHGGDVARIRTMMKYGGIYLDNDVYVIRNLDKYRKYEIAINWDEDQFLGSQVIIAHKDARFLREWLESYREYHPDLWYYNAGQRPTEEILYHHPELIHRVKRQFGADLTLSYYLYTWPEFDWRSLDTIHLMINHRHYMDPYYNETPVFNESIVQNYKYPFGAMARDIIDASGLTLL